MPSTKSIQSKGRTGAHRATNGRKSRLLQKQAYTEVKRLIVSGEAPPGSFLSERQLAERLGMSKTPVHVALERLEAEEFVNVSPQQGIVVRELTIEDIVDHFELRQAIESFVARQIAGRLSEDQTQRLKANLAEQKQSVATDDISRHVELDAEFHLLLCDFLANRQITQIMEQLREKIHQVILRITRIDQDRMVESFEEHSRIAEAIIHGEVDRAVALAVEHLEIGKQRILNPRRR